MKKEITLASLLGILSTPFLLILGWGISVTSRLEKNDEIIQENKSKIEKIDARVEKVDDKVDENYKLIGDKLDQILIKLGEKEDRSSK